MSADVETVLRPGERLREARERAGLSCVEVAEQLNLTARQIAALEAEDYAALPGPAYVQGYLRGYARLLGLDGTALVDTFRADQGGTLQVRRVPSSVRPNLDRGGSHRHWGLVALVLVLMGLWMWQHWSQGGFVEDGGNETQTMAAGPGGDTMADGARAADATIAPPQLRADPAGAGPAGDRSPSAQRVDRGGIQASAQAPFGTGMRAETGAETGVQPVAAAEPDSQADGPVAVDAGAVGFAETPPQSALGPDRLTLRFSGDCWVEISDGSGATLAAELKRADEVLELRGERPFRVLLGYAPAVDMTLNGRRVPVEADGRNQTASLVVGNG